MNLLRKPLVIIAIVVVLAFVLGLIAINRGSRTQSTDNNVVTSTSIYAPTSAAG